MFNVRFLLVCQDWKVRDIAINQPSLTLAYRSSIRMIKELTDMGTLDFLPLGNEEYVIWGQGKCQGYMGIKEAGLEISVPVLDGGQ